MKSIAKCRGTQSVLGGLGRTVVDRRRSDGQKNQHSPDQLRKIGVFLGPGFTADQARAVRAESPGAIILMPISANEIGSGAPGVLESYFLHDVKGNRIQDWPGNSYVLNMTKPEVADFLAQYTYQLLVNSDFAFDGIFFDTFETSISWMTTDVYGNAIQIDADGDGIPDNPASLDAAWRTGMYRLVRSFRNMMPHAYVTGHLSTNPPGQDDLAVFNGNSLAYQAVDVREGKLPFSNFWNNYQGWFGSGQQPVIANVQLSPPNQIAYGYGFAGASDAMPPSTASFAQSFYPNRNGWADPDDRTRND